MEGCIEHTIGLMEPSVVPELVVAVGHKADQVRSWVQSAGLPHTVRFAQQSADGALDAMLESVPHVSRDHVVVATTDEIRHGLDLSGLHTRGVD